MNSFSSLIKNPELVSCIEVEWECWNHPSLQQVSYRFSSHLFWGATFKVLYIWISTMT
eukprot:m.72691 g.72691  ORF g.72691 m.72691 type:complete len:58 (+) comp12341_c0_seq3:162-335(+)